MEVKLYIYDKAKANKMGNEIKNILMPIKYIDKLNGEINTLDLTITKSSKATAYLPSTRFFVKIIDNNNEELIEMSLRSDEVKKEVLQSNNYYSHKLSLGDPAIELQQRSCDNFSMTYKLDDVSLSANSIQDGVIQEVEIEENAPDSMVKDSRLPSGIFTNKFDIGNLGGIGVIDAEIQRQHVITRFDGKLEKRDNKLYITNLTNEDNSMDLKRDVIYDNGLSQDQISALDTKGALYINGNHTNLSNSFNTENGKTYYNFFVPIFECYENYENGTGFVRYPLDTKVSIYKRNLLLNNSRELVREYNTNLPKKMLWQTYSNNIVTPSMRYDRNLNIQGENPSSQAPLTYSHSLDCATNYMYNGTITDHINNTEGGFRDYIFITQGFHSLNSMSQNLAKTNGAIIGTLNDVMYIDSKTSTAYQTEFNNNQITEIMVESGMLNNIEVEPNYEYTFEFKPVFRDCNGNEINSIASVEGFKGIINDAGTIMRSDYEFYIRKNSSDYYKNYSFFVLGKESIANTFLQSAPPLTAMDLFEKIKVVSNSYDLNVYGQDRINLINTQIIEEIYSNKNCWEMLLELGKYVHAQPRIKYDISTGGLELYFVYYGSSNEVTNSNATANAIFNSRNIQDYICELDAYTTNMFQYGNSITEYIKPSENDGTQYVITDNAVLKTTYPILELLKLEIANVYSSSLDNDWHDMTEYVFSKDVYSVLSPVKSTQQPHCKPNSLYYELGSTQIMGLQFVESSANEVEPYAIKNIIYQIYRSSANVNVQNIAVTNFIFRITYRPKDNLRIPYIRPDVRKYLYNGYNGINNELPQHTQFTNQDSKYLDSKKYGELSYGKLIRTGNLEYSTQTWQKDFTTRFKAGDFVFIQNQPYYVADVATLVYNYHITQQLTLSQDHNALSQIIGINSEPRFYEISEQSMVERQITTKNIIVLSTHSQLIQDLHQQVVTNGIDLAMTETITYNLYKLLFQNVRPNYAKVEFTPSDEDSNAEIPTLMIPVNSTATGHTFVMSCQMQDNFSAGNCQSRHNMVDTINSASWLSPLLSLIENTMIKSKDTYFKMKEPVKYTDKFGRVKTATITYGTFTPTPEFVQSMNNSSFADILPKYDNSFDSAFEPLYRARMNVAKDSREKLKFNNCFAFTTSSDRFIVGSSIFDIRLNSNNQPTDQYYIVLLSKEVNKFSKDKLIMHDYLAVSRETAIITQGDSEIVISMPTAYDNAFVWEDVKSIALAYNIRTTWQGKVTCNFLFARNVSGLTVEDKKDDFVISAQYGYRPITNNRQ